MNTKHISIAALSLGLVFGATACTSPEPEPAPNSSPSESEVKRAEAGKIDASTEKLPLTEEVSFTEDNFLITTSEETEFTIEDYGIVEQLPSGEKPAEGEVFHAIHFTTTQPKNANTFRPVMSYLIDGKAVEDKTNIYEGGTKIISAPQDAEIAVVLTTKDSKSGESITQEIDFKTAERLSEGVADAWYAARTGIITPKTLSVPVDPEQTAVINMDFTSATKESYDFNKGYAPEGMTWLVLESDGVEWEAGNNVIKNETATIWLTDEDNNVYQPVGEWDILSPSKIFFEVPADSSEFIIYTKHSGTIDSEGTTIKEVRDFDISGSTISFNQMAT